LWAVVGDRASSEKADETFKTSLFIHRGSNVVVTPVCLRRPKWLSRSEQPASRFSGSHEFIRRFYCDEFDTAGGDAGRGCCGVGASHSANPSIAGSGIQLGV
jgi:hypothetical protein